MDRDSCVEDELWALIPLEALGRKAQLINEDEEKRDRERFF